MPDSMTMSPQIDQYSQTPPEEQAEQMFKERFSKMAYSVLFSKFAELASNVVTFKIMESKADEGRGIGAFIVMHNQKPVYIPVIMTEGQLKPMDLFYYKELNTFLPLTPQWLEEISKMALDEMGQGAQLPQQVAQDVNIRDLILPPLTSSGRIGYASDQSEDYAIKEMFKKAEDQASVSEPQFLNIIKSASATVLNGMKLAFQKYPRIPQKLAGVYGIDALVQAFNEGYENDKKRVKVASAMEALDIFTKYASAGELKEAFGSATSKAYSEIQQKGFVIRDTRSGISKVAVQIEAPTFLEEPGAQPSWFKLFFLDGPAENYYVIPFPYDNGSMQGRPVCVHNDGEYMREHKVPTEYLLVSGDLKRAWKDTNIMGMRLSFLDEVKSTPMYKMLNEKSGDTPKTGSWGFFLLVGNKGVNATTPFLVEQVIKDKGKTTVVSEDYPHVKYIIDDDPSRKKFDFAMNGNIAFVPATAKWVEITTVPFKDGRPDYDKNPSMHGQAYRDMRRTSLIHDPKLFSRWLGSKMQEHGSTPTEVKSAGLDQWWIGNNPQTYAFVDALKKVATVYGISTDDAIGVLKDAQINGRSSAQILNKNNFEALKLAVDSIMQPPPQQDPSAQMQQGQMPPGMQGMSQDPNAQQGMMADPQAMQGQMGQAAPPPPPISPTDLAISEAVQQLSQQNQQQMMQNDSQMQMLQQQMQMQQQNTQQLIGVLQGIQQRAQQISAATNGQIPEGAAGAPATAAQALAPQAPPEPEPPAMPVMSEEPFSAETVAEQINPEMLDQASDLQDQGVFDTAAIAMLSGVSALQDTVANYVPNMETALDNVGRVLLTLQMKEPETKEAIGEESYVSLEDTLRSVFKSFGDAILMLSHNAESAKERASSPNVSTRVSAA